MEIGTGAFKLILMCSSMVIGIAQGQTSLIGQVIGNKRQKANHGRKEDGRKTIMVTTIIKGKAIIVGVTRNT